VGSRTLTLAYYLSEWERIEPSQRPQHADPREARMLFLEDLVVRHALALEALRDPRPLSAEQQAALVAVREDAMLNRLYARIIVETVQVDEVDKDLFVKELTNILELEAYLFPTQEAAQAWYSRLAAGTPLSRLEDAARRADPEILERRDYGYVTRENMPDSMARVVFRLAPGRVSAPTAAQGRWALYSVADIHVRPPGVDLEDTEAILNKARELRLSEARERYRQRLTDSLGVEYEVAAMDTLVARFLTVPPRNTTDASGAPVFNMLLPLPAISPEDSSLVLARTPEQAIEARHVLRHLAEMNAALRPEIRSLEALRAVVDRIVVDGTLRAQAWKLGLDRDLQVVEIVERRREGFLVERLFADSVASHIPTERDTLEAYYEAHRDHFHSAPTAEIWMLVTATKAEGESLLAVARGGADLAELARTHSLHGESGERGGGPLSVRQGDSENVELEDAIFATATGEFGGPVETQNGWVFFRVESKVEGGARSFDEELPHVTQDFQREREERGLEAFVERVMQRVPVETYPDRVAHLAD
jgi:parvulin-like peptidyl-prolyl isomerase